MGKWTKGQRESERVCQGEEKDAVEDCNPWTYWLSNREKAGTAWTQSGFCSHSDSVLRALSCHPRWREGALAWQGIKEQKQNKKHKRNKHKQNVHSVNKENGTGHQSNHNAQFKNLASKSCQAFCCHR